MDDLTKIKGIGAVTAKRLAEAGIDSFAALAAFEISDPRFASLGVTEVQLQGWIEDARKHAPEINSETSDADADAAAQDAQPTGAAGTDNREPKSDRKSGAGDPAGPAKGALSGIVLLVTAKVPRRRRGGISFGLHETRLFLADLTDDQVEAIEGDPMLDVKRVTEAG